MPATASRPVWKGSISFGLVTIPIKLHTAVRRKSVSFHLIHKTCEHRIQEKRWCPHHKKEVPWNQVIKGYQPTKGHIIPMTPEDFEKIPVPAKHVINITDFVEQEEVDPILYNQAYYSEPGEGGEKAYNLLRDALEKKNLIGIAKIVFREKEQLCALRVMNGTLLLETLFYADEVRVKKPVTSGRGRVSDSELKMALALIDMLKGPFRIEKYKDEYREALMEIVEAKAKGKRLPALHEQVPSTQVIDLMAALKKSLENGGKKKTSPRRKSAARKDASKKKRTHLKAITGGTKSSNVRNFPKRKAG